MTRRRIVLGVFLLWLTPVASGQWVEQTSPTKERLRGLSAVNSQVAWASGNRGTVLVTTDGGSTGGSNPSQEPRSSTFGTSTP